MTSRNRTALDDKNVSRRWRKQLCPYCKQSFLGRGGAVTYCSARCASAARYKRRVTRLKREADEQRRMELIEEEPTRRHEGYQN
jgi:hypothetical protein